MSRQKHNNKAGAPPPPLQQENVFALLDNDDDDDDEVEEKLEEQQQSPSNNTTSTCLYDASVDASDASTGNQRPRDRIAQLPDAIIQLMTHTFFDDASAVALCQTQHLTFRLLKDSYRVRGEAELVWKEMEKIKEEEEKGVESQQQQQQQQQQPHVKKEKKVEGGEIAGAAAAAATALTSPSSSSATPPLSPMTSTTTEVTHHRLASIEVAYPCLMPMQLVQKHYPEQGALDPRSYKLPTYSPVTSRTHVVDAAAAAASMDVVAATLSSDTRSPYRIGQPQKFYIRTGIDKWDRRTQQSTELTQELFNSLPLTTNSLRILSCGLSALQSLTRLTRLHALNFQRVESFAHINEIARLLPQLRVLHLDCTWSLASHSEVNEETDASIFLPQALEKLYIGMEFRNLENRLVLPENLRVLHYLGHTMSLQEWKLPDTLTELRIGCHFNENVDGWTPPTALRTLMFGYEDNDHFNKDISKIVWPSGLTRLVFGRFFRQSLANVKLPDSMLHLELKSNETNMFGIIRDGADRSENPFKIPPHLESFLIDPEFPSDTRGPLVFALDLPQTVTRVKLSLRIILDIPNLHWPSSITDLQLDAQHMIYFENFPLPPRLRRLELNGNEVISLKKFNVPVTLESLSLPRAASCSMVLLQSLLRSCAHSLQTLKLGKCPQRSMSSLVLPKNLTHLELPHHWNRPVSELPKFPSSLRYLKFGFDWNQPLNGLKFPSTLLRLHFGNIDRDVTPLNAILPENLRELSFPSFGCDKVRTTLPKLKVPQFCSVFAVFVTSY